MNEGSFTPVKMSGPMRKIVLKKRALSFALFLFVYFSFSLSISAQGLTDFNQAISAVVVPPNPAPGQTVSITLTSSLYNLNDSNIVWKKNGKTEKEGKDARNFSFSLGGAGSKTSIEAVVETKAVGSITKSFSFSPGEVLLLYEAKTYTPPFYKGKALPSPQATISLLAITNFKTSGGVIIPGSELTFTWKKNDSVDGANSGRGKNTYQYNNGALLSEAPLIEVIVSSPDYNVSGGADFRVTNADPEIIFYEENPLRGVISEVALINEFSLNKTEATIVAQPFFFSTSKKESSSFLYSWKINNSSVSTPSGRSSVLTIRRPGEKGSSLLSLSIENGQRIFQVASNNLNVSYGN